MTGTTAGFGDVLPTPTKPRRIDRYEILGEIARGGMGVVYRARDPALERQVALKVLLDPEPDPRFLQEARSAAALRHRGIVAIEQTGQDRHGRQFMVMELVEGESLKARIERGPLPIDEALGIMLQLCAAMSCAHQQGVIHRDLKPQNVLLTPEGVAKITDFGLGKILDQSQCLTQTGQVMGTPAYMPPEQAEGNRAAMGPCSDVYSLGATLYALLTGRPPFRAASQLNLLHAVLFHAPEPPSKHRPEVLPDLDAIVLRCLAKAPAHRYPTVAELSRAIQSELESASSPAPPPSRAWAPWATAGLVLLGLGSASAVLWARRAPTEEGPTVVDSAGETTQPEPSRAERYNRGVARSQDGDYLGAIEEFDQAIVLDPSYAEAFAGRGLARNRLAGESEDKLQRALDDLNRAIELAPELRVAYSERGRVHLALENDRKAVEDFSQAIRRSTPAHATDHFGRGMARMNLREWQGAIEDVEHALERELEPSLAEKARLLREMASGKTRDALTRARDFNRSANWEEARRLTDDVIARNPTLVEAYLHRGMARTNLGDLAGAEADYGRAIELRPTAAAHWSRALLRSDRGFSSGAIEDFDSAIRLEPDAQAYSNRAAERLRLGDLQGGLDDYAQAQALDPDCLDAEAYFNLGLAYGELHEWPDQEEALNQAILRRRDDAEAHFSRSRARAELGDYEGAVADLERCLQLEPNATWAGAARENLAAAREKLAEQGDETR